MSSPRRLPPFSTAERPERLPLSTLGPLPSQFQIVFPAQSPHPLPSNHLTPTTARAAPYAFSVASAPTANGHSLPSIPPPQFHPEFVSWKDPSSGCQPQATATQQTSMQTVLGSRTEIPVEFAVPLGSKATRARGSYVARTRGEPVVRKARGAQVTRISVRDSTVAVSPPPQPQVIESGSEDEEQDTRFARHWTGNDRLLLLGWMSENLRNYEDFKANPKKVADKIARTVLGSRRTGEQVRRQWEQMKKKHRAATQKLRATSGEGQREDSEEWASIKMQWLDKSCPYYDAIDGVLQRYVVANRPLFL